MIPVLRYFPRTRTSGHTFTGGYWFLVFVRTPRHNDIECQEIPE